MQQSARRNLGQSRVVRGLGLASIVALVLLTPSFASAQCAGGTGPQTGLGAVSCSGVAAWTGQALASGATVTHNNCLYRANRAIGANSAWAPGAAGVYLYGNGSACPAAGCNYGAEGTCGTATATPTTRATATATATATSRATATATTRATATATSRATATATPRTTATPTATSRATATSTPRPTATSTPTATARVTPTPTPTTGGCVPLATPTLPPAWAVGTTYQVGNIVSYAGNVYSCVIPHTAIAGWEPNGGGSTLWSLVTGSGGTPPPPRAIPAGHKYRVGYFVQWGIYGRQYFVRNLDTTGAASKLTHVLYSFSNLDGVNGTCMNGVTVGVGGDPQGVDQGTGAGDAFADYGRPMAASESVDGVADLAGSRLMGNFNQLRKLKAKYPSLHVLISLGGWTYSKFFSKVAATAASRQKFVQSCIDMYIKGNLPAYNGAGGTGAAAGIFDGFDIDWEYPGSVYGHPGNIVNCVQPPITATDPWTGGTCNDKANFVALMREFRTQLDALGGGCRKYELAAFGTGDGISKLGLGWDVPGLMQSFDFVNVQGYDFHGVGSDNTWEAGRTGHQGNLWEDVTPPADPYSYKFSSDAAITAWMNAGAPANKLTLGIPFYARIWKGVTAGGVFGEWQVSAPPPTGGAACGQFGCDIVNAGTRNTNNLSAIGCSGANLHRDATTVANWCYNGNEWATYDDATTITTKMTYIKNRGLLGAMIWEMSGDNGDLMSAIHNNLP